eukprot:3304803-Prymnesium_polylepis.1
MCIRDRGGDGGGSGRKAADQVDTWGLVSRGRAIGGWRVCGRRLAAIRRLAPPARFLSVCGAEPPRWSS